MNYTQPYANANLIRAHWAGPNESRCLRQNVTAVYHIGPYRTIVAPL